MFKALTAYKQAQEYAHFGSELAVAAQNDLARGERLYKILNQAPGERYTLVQQALMLDIALGLSENESLNVDSLKSLVVEAGMAIKNDKEFEKARDALKAKSLVEVQKADKPAEAQVATPAVAQPEAKS